MPMYQLLTRCFVKKDGRTDAQIRQSYGKLAGIVGMSTNLLLCILKILGGAIFGSIAIVADGINNLSDAAGSVITLLGFKIAGKAPDKEHPFGHGRSEYIAGCMVSILVSAIGLLLLKSSVEKTISPEPPDFGILLVVILCVSIALKLWQTWFNVRIGKEIHSQAMTATAADSRNDVLSTSAVLVSVLVYRFTGLNVDGPVGILVAGFIIWSGMSLIKDTLSPILGKQPDKALVTGIKDILMAHPYILDIHDLIVHDYGPTQTFATVHCEVDAARNVMLTHDAIDQLEREVLETLHVHLTIHMDPVEVNDPLTEQARLDVQAVCAGFPQIRSFHDVRISQSGEQIDVAFDIVLDFESALLPEQLRSLLQENLQARNPGYRAIITVDNEYAQ